MTYKIESLTVEQESRFDEFVQKWLKIGLSTTPVDLEKATEAAILSYTIAGLKAPTQFFLVDGPIAAIKFIKTMDPSKQSRDIFDEMLYGGHDAYWLSFYDYMLEVVGIEGCKKFEGLFGLAKYSGWLNAYEDVVVFQHPPEVIKFDDRNVLHCQDGPAIRYRDGVEVYAWHGVTIPGEWISDKKALTPDICLHWANVEQRRCACEIYGWANIIRDLNPLTIDKDGDPEIGTLIEVDIPEIGKERFLLVLCGTKREFAIPIPPTVNTAIEAQAWSWGLSESDFVIPEIRT